MRKMSKKAMIGSTASLGVIAILAFSSGEDDAPRGAANAETEDAKSPSTSPADTDPQTSTAATDGHALVVSGLRLGMDFKDAGNEIRRRFPQQYALTVNDVYVHNDTGTDVRYDIMTDFNNVNSDGISSDSWDMRGSTNGILTGVSRQRTFIPQRSVDYDKVPLVDPTLAALIDRYGEPHLTIDPLPNDTDKRQVAWYWGVDGEALGEDGKRICHRHIDLYYEEVNNEALESCGSVVRFTYRPESHKPEYLRMYRIDAYDVAYQYELIEVMDRWREQREQERLNSGNGADV